MATMSPLQSPLEWILVKTKNTPRKQFGKTTADVMEKTCSNNKTQTWIWISNGKMREM